MIETLDDLQKSLPLLLLRGGVLLAASFLVAFLLRRRAQYLRLVWTTTAILLLALPFFQSFKVWHIPAVDLVWEKIFPSLAPPAELTAAFKSEAIRIDLSPGLSEGISTNITMEPLKASPSISAPAQPTPQKPLPWLVILWLTGVCLGLGYLALGRLVLWRLRSCRKPATANWWDSLSTVGKETGTSVRSRIVFVPEIDMPLTVGILSPEIWLPESARDFDSRHRESVLRHELAHIRGRDALWQLLFSIALATQWMNPLAWMAARSFRLAQERVCDDVAMGTEDAAAEEYAFLLLEVARNASLRINFKTIAAPTLMMAKRSSLKKRIKLILDKNMKRTSITRPQMWLTTAIVAALGMPMALVGFGQESQEAAQAPTTRTEPNDGGAALLKRKMKGITIPAIDMNRIPLREAVDFLHETSFAQDASNSDKSGRGINFVLLKSALSGSGQGSSKLALEKLKKATHEREVMIEEQERIMIMNELKGAKMALMSQIESLSTYNGEQLLTYTSGVNLPDNINKSLYTKYLELKREIEVLKASGLDERHPKILSQNLILEEMRKNLDEGVVNLRKRLTGQLQRMSAEIEALESSINTQDYVNTPNDIEKELAIIETMKLQLIMAGSDDHAINPHLVSLKLRQVPFEDALRYITLQCGMSYAIHSSAVVIGSPDEIAQLDELNH